MKSSDNLYEKNLVCFFIKFLLYVFKWLCLVFAVFTAGITIGLLLMYLIRGNDIPNLTLAQMVSYLCSYSSGEALTMIGVVGKVKMIVAGCGIGFASALTYALLYTIGSRFITIFDSIIDGNMFTKENVRLINESLPLTFFIAFLSPVIMFCIISSTDVFNFADVNVSGVIYICIGYVLKLIFEYGYSLERKLVKADKTISDYKSKEEAKLESKKEEAISESELPEKKEKAKKEKHNRNRRNRKPANK